MQHYKILSVTWDELPMCLECIKAAFSVMADKYKYSQESYPSSAAYLTLHDLQEAKNMNVHMYAAWMDGKIVGYVQLEKKPDGVYSFQRFAVHPDYQSHGFGRALVSFCKNKATVYGGKKIKLLMINENESLKNFYISCGFKLSHTGRDDAHPFEYAIMEMEL